MQQITKYITMPPSERFWHEFYGALLNPQSKTPSREDWLRTVYAPLFKSKQDSLAASMALFSNSLTALATYSGNRARWFYNKTHFRIFPTFLSFLIAWGCKKIQLPLNWPHDIYNPTCGRFERV